MVKSDYIECDGIVEETLRGAQFKVRIEGSEKIVQAHISGKIRKHNIHISVGDHVRVEINPYDKTRGIISFRKRHAPSA